MPKSTRKKTKGATPTKKTRKTSKNQRKAPEYVNHLLKLHKLQGILLVQLKKEVR